MAWLFISLGEERYLIYYVYFDVLKLRVKPSTLFRTLLVPVLKPLVNEGRTIFCGANRLKAASHSKCGAGTRGLPARVLDKILISGGRVYIPPPLSFFFRFCGQRGGSLPTLQ